MDLDLPSNRLNQAFTIKMKSSLNKKVLIILPHASAAVILFIFLGFKDVNLIYFILSLLCIGISLVYFVRLHLTYCSNKSIYKIHIHTNDNWSVTFRDDVKDNISISASSFTSNILIILIFKDSSENFYTALITPDSVNKDEFRKLKVLIKTQKLAV